MLSIRNLSYEDRLKLLDLTTLVERRQRDDMIQLFKIIHGLILTEKIVFKQFIIKLEVTASKK